MARRARSKMEGAKFDARAASISYCRYAQISPQSPPRLRNVREWRSGFFAVAVLGQGRGKLDKTAFLCKISGEMGLPMSGPHRPGPRPAGTARSFRAIRRPAGGVSLDGGYGHAEVVRTHTPSSDVTVRRRSAAPPDPIRCAAASTEYIHVRVRAQRERRPGRGAGRVNGRERVKCHDRFDATRCSQ